MPKIMWTEVDGRIYGNIKRRNYPVTLKIIFERGWVESCWVFDSQHPSEGWKHLVSVQHFDADKPMYFHPWTKGPFTGQDEANNLAGVDMLKKHAELLFQGL